MTTPIETAYVEIKPDFKNFGADLRRQTTLAASGFSGLQNSAKGLNGAVGGLSTSLKGLGSGAALAGVQALQTGLVAATTAAIGLGTAIATIGIKGASDLANTRLAIGSLGDQLKDVTAEDVVQQLRDLSVQAGVSLGALTKFEQGFVSLGVSGQDSLSVIETTLSGLAASGNLSAEALQGVGRALQQIGSKPFLQLEELNQISDQIPAASRVKIIQQLAKDTGDSIAEVQERFRLGTQQSGDALTAVVKVIGALDTSGQALENRTKTIGGAFAKARAEITNSLADVFTPLGEQLAEQLNSLDTAGLAEKIGQPIADAFAAITPDVIAALPDIVEGLALTFQLLAPVVAQTASAIGSIAGAIVDNQDQIRAFGENLGEVFDGVQAIVAGLAPAFAVVLAGVGPVFDILGSIGGLISDLQPTLEFLGQAFALTLVPAELAIEGVALALNLLEPAFDAIASAINYVAGLIQDVFLGAVDAALSALQAMLDLIGKLPDLPGLPDIGAKAREAADGVQSLRDQLNGVNGTVVTATIRIQTIGGQQFDVGSGGDALALPDNFNAELERQMRAAQATLKSSISPVFKNTGAAAPDKAGAAAAKKAEADLKRAVATVKKELNELAKNTADQSVTQIQRSFDQLVAGMKDAGLKEYVKQVRTFEKTLVGLAKQRDKLNDQLKDARDNLKSLKDESASFADSVRSAVNDLGNVAQESQGIATTFVGIRQQLLSAIGTTRQFSQAIASLTAAGLNQTSLRQLIEAGPQAGLAAAQALVGAGQAAITGPGGINDLQAQLDEQGKSLGASVANTFYAAGIQAAAGLVAGLQSQEAAIEAQMNRIADRMAKAIKKALQIKSPSALLAREVGVPAGQGIVGGLVKEIDRMTGVTGAVRNYASSVVFGPGSVVAHGATEAGASRIGNGLGLGIKDVLERQLAQSILNGTG